MTQKSSKDIEALHMHESFARFIKQVHDDREMLLREMHDKDTEQLQQISGQLLYMTRMLDDARWDELRKKHAERL